MLYTFAGSADGANPTVGLIGDTTGLFGTAQRGGDLSHTHKDCPSSGCGVVLKVGP